MSEKYFFAGIMIIYQCQQSFNKIAMIFNERTGYTTILWLGEAITINEIVCILYNFVS